jgi:hypothetical protein
MRRKSHTGSRVLPSTQGATATKRVLRKSNGALRGLPTRRRIGSVACRPRRRCARRCVLRHPPSGGDRRPCRPVRNRCSSCDPRPIPRPLRSRPTCDRRRHRRAHFRPDQACNRHRHRRARCRPGRARRPPPSHERRARARCLPLHTRRRPAFPPPSKSTKKSRRCVSRLRARDRFVLPPRAGRANPQRISSRTARFAYTARG